jgi:hypothetical protein
VIFVEFIVFSAEHDCVAIERDAIRCRKSLDRRAIGPRPSRSQNAENCAYFAEGAANEPISGTKECSFELADEQDCLHGQPSLVRKGEG